MAGVALAALASAGAAEAADVMPIVVPAVTPAVVPPPGPAVSLKVDTGIEVAYVFGTQTFDAGVGNAIDFKVVSASGWGMEVITDAVTAIVVPIEFDADVTTRLFRATGPIELGAHATFEFGVPGGLDGYGFGADIAYEGDLLTLEAEAGAAFLPGFGFNAYTAIAEITAHLGDRLDLYAGADFMTDLIVTAVNAWAGARLDLGVVAPYAGIDHREGPNGWSANVGIDIEKQIGTGPFSLIGYTEARFGFFGPTALGGIGLRFSRGAVE